MVSYQKHYSRWLIAVVFKDGKICLTRGYPVQPDLNGAGFTRLVKQMGRDWVLIIKKPPKQVGFGYYENSARTWPGYIYNMKFKKKKP